METAGGGSTTKKCYNGFNYFVLGWHGEQTNVISLSPGNARVYNLVGMADVKTGGIVNIRADNYFITFNLKRGIIGEVGEYENQVVIHKGQSTSGARDVTFGKSTFDSYSSTVLVKGLASPGNEYSVNVSNGQLRIRLCSIDTVGSDGVMVSIGLNAVNCNNVGGTSHPQGIRELQPGKAVSSLSGAKDDILEFIMPIPKNPNEVECKTSGGTGNVDLLMNFLSTPQVLHGVEGNTVRRSLCL